MVEIIKEEIKGKALKDGSFEITINRVDKLTAKEVLDNYDGLVKFIEQAKKDLDGMDEQAKKLKERLNTDIENHQKKVDALFPLVDTAKEKQVVPTGVG